MDPTLRLLVRTYQPPRGQAWHGGPTPLGALRGVSHRQAAWVPAPGRHSIWALTLHIAYWKHTVRRRLLGAGVPRFPRGPSNWPLVPPRPTAAAWAADRALLRDEHELLLETLQDLRPGVLGRSAGGRKRWTVGDLVVGIAMHDAWHAGQIQMLKRLWKAR